MGRTTFIDTGDFTALDLETTGRSHHDQIIEIAMVRFRNGMPVEALDRLVNPGIPIPAQVTRITGITDDMVEAEQPISEVIDDFVSFLGDDPIVAHNVLFDIDYLERALNHELDTDFINTCRASEHVYGSGRDRNTLEALVGRLRAEGVDFPDGSAHRARWDATAAGIAYVALLPALLEMSDGDLDSLVSTSHAIGGGEMREAVFTGDEIPEGSTLDGKNIAMTGTFEGGIREKLMELAIAAGAHRHGQVKESTDYLVVGNTGFQKNVNEGKSKKIKTAEKHRADNGHPLIVSETAFVEAFELDWP